MKSFRHDQFQAVFQGLAIADALTQGPPAIRAWVQRGAPQTEPLPPCRDWLSGFKASFATAIEPALPRVAGTPGEGLFALPPGEWGAIASLPILLRFLDAPAQGWAILAPHLDDTAQATATVLASILTRGVNNPGAIAQPQVVPLESATTAQTAIALAVQCVTAAQGSVDLGLRLGLRWAPRSPSIPLLVGILAGGTAGLAGIPTHWRWAIAHHPAIAPWYQARWQLLPDMNLTAASTQLWQQWAGYHRRVPKSSRPLSAART